MSFPTYRVYAEDGQAVMRANQGGRVFTDLDDALDRAKEVAQSVGMAITVFDRDGSVVAHFGYMPQ